MTSTLPLNGKICLVTGATSGIGRSAAQSLAEQGATVVLAGRNLQKTAAAVAEIRQQTGNPNVDSLLADLSVQAGVRALAQAFLGRYPRLHVLVNNAGALVGRREVTADGLERTFALNHLSYFLLTNLLLPALRAAGQPGAAARVVNVASGAHWRAPGLDFDDLQAQRGYFSYRAYARSKLANVLFTYELARRLEREAAPVTANVLHPGLIASGFGAGNGPLYALAYVFINALGGSAAEGADTAVYLASSPDVEGVSGKYYYRRQAMPSSPASYDESAARRLWDVSLRLTEQSQPVLARQ